MEDEHQKIDWPPRDPVFLAFTERYDRGANGLHTLTPLGFFQDGWNAALKWQEQQEKR